MHLGKMVSSYKKDYGKVLALLKKASNKKDTFREKMRIDPLETKLLDRLVLLENSLHKKIHVLAEFKNGSKDDKIESKLQGLRDSLTIVTQTHNALENTYWYDIPEKVWKLFFREIKQVRYPTKVNDEQVYDFLHELSEYHDKHSNFSILPDTDKANKYTDKPINDKKFLLL